MSFEYLVGKWEGFFTYGPAYPKRFQSIRDKFVLDLKVDNGIITGTLVDPYVQKHFAEPATVEGVLTEQSLSFVKKYPYFMGIDDDHEVFTDKSMPSQEIHYTGRLKRKLFSRRCYVKGKWEISGSFLDEHGNVNYYRGEGKWQMHPMK